MIGTRLGPYEITAKLGEGGMGEVWRATDAKLGREVAIKVLPAALATDAKALARFDAEARAVAALSHPNILAIFDLGREGDTVFTVSELLDGVTLRDRIERDGACSSRETVEIGAQIARGLAAAHERGIVHRDLKPANVFLTRDGRVKILDFGLAKQVEPPSSHSRLAAAPTIGPGTEPGTVLGTVGYMAPEQVRGEPADERSDLFALGVVLYELATGERAFARETSAETMTAILRHEPPRLGLPDSPIPPALERVIRHLLEKNPRQRFRAAEDVAFALENLVGAASSERSSAALRTDPVAPARARSLGRVALAAALLVAAGAGWVASRAVDGRAAAAESTRTLRPSFRQLTKTPGGEIDPTLAPDGQSFVFVKRDGEDLDLFTQRIDGARPVGLTADCEKDDIDPAFSFDGKWIAYRSDCDGGGVFVMGATGESRRRVADFGYAPAWSPDGRELAVVTEQLAAPSSRNSISQLWAVSIDSGARRRVSEQDAMGPTWSPDGRRIAFWGLRTDTFQRDLWTVAADGSELAASAAVSLLDDPPLDWSPAFSRDGRYLLFVSSRGGTFNLWRLAIDQGSGRALGVPEPLTAPSSSIGRFSVAADGRHLIFTDRNIDGRIVRARYDHARRALAEPPTEVFSGSFELREQKLSPDGAWLLFVNEDLPQHLHLVRSDGSGYRQLTTGTDRNRQGVWSPQGDWVVFQTNRGANSLAVIRPDGGGWQELPVGRGLATPSWSPDGKTIAVVASSSGFAGLIDISKGFASASMERLPELADGGLFWPAAWSTDGALLVGRANRDGQAVELVVREMASGRYRLLPTSDAGGSQRREDRTMAFVDERQVVYSDDRAIWLLDVLADEPAKTLYQASGRRPANLSASADGRWLSWIERADESDIWLMSFEGSIPDG